MFRYVYLFVYANEITFTEEDKHWYKVAPLLYFILTNICFDKASHFDKRICMRNFNHKNYVSDLASSDETVLVYLS